MSRNKPWKSSDFPSVESGKYYCADCEHSSDVRRCRTCKRRCWMWCGCEECKGYFYTSHKCFIEARKNTVKKSSADYPSEKVGNMDYYCLDCVRSSLFRKCSSCKKGCWKWCEKCSSYNTSRHNCSRVTPKKKKKKSISEKKKKKRRKEKEKERERKRKKKKKRKKRRKERERERRRKRKKKKKKKKESSESDSDDSDEYDEDKDDDDEEEEEEEEESEEEEEEDDEDLKVIFELEDDYLMWPDENLGDCDKKKNKQNNVEEEERVDDSITGKKRKRELSIVDNEEDEESIAKKKKKRKLGMIPLKNNFL